MKIAAIIGLSLVLIFIGVNVYTFTKQEHDLSANLANVQSQLTKAQSDEASLESEEQYLANPVNLEKELRSRFNYVNPGEKMIIIVPLGSTTASTSVSD
jgi:cell division protein FtsB